MTIPYAPTSWNPTSGCSVVSPGCANCWAETVSHRFSMTHLPWTPENAAENVALHPARLEEPLHWRKPQVVAVNLNGDLFHKEVPFEFIDKVFAVMALCPQHTFLLLTKRIGRAVDYYSRGNCDDYPRETDVHIAMEERGWQSRDDILTYALPGSIVPNDPAWPLSNLWLGTSVEDQATWDSRVRDLLTCAAAGRFVSIEPLLGPIQFGRAYIADTDWIVVGAESGPRARPMELDWVRSIRDQCRDTDVPMWLKQCMVGHKRVNMPMLDGVVYDQLPEELDRTAPGAV